MKTSAKEIQIAPPGLAGDDELVERTVAHHQVGGYFNRIFYRDPGVSDPESSTTGSVARRTCPSALDAPKRQFLVAFDRA